MLERIVPAFILLLLASDAQAQPAVQKSEPGVFVTYHLAHPPTRLEARRAYGYGGAVGYRFSKRYDLGLYARRSPADHSPFSDAYKTGLTTIGLRVAKTTDVSDRSLAVRLAFSGSVTVQDESEEYETLETFEYRGGPKMHSYGFNLEGAFLWPSRLSENVRVSPGAGGFAAVRQYTSQTDFFRGDTDIDPGRATGTAGVLLTLPASVNVGGDDWLSAEASLRVDPLDVIYEPARDVYSIVFSYAF